MAERRTLAKGDDDPEIKKDIKVNAVQLVNVKKMLKIESQIWVN